MLANNGQFCIEITAIRPFIAPKSANFTIFYLDQNGAAR
jgi:hypothetical protein